MLHHRLSVFFVLTIPLACLATLLEPRWDDMRVKHSWKSVPENWESLGLPPNDTTLNLYVALKSRRPNAMIDALHEVSTPGHPKHVISPLLHVCTYSHIHGTDMVHTYRKRRLLSLLRRTNIHPRSSVHGLNTTAYSPLPSR